MKNMTVIAFTNEEVALIAAALAAYEQKEWSTLYGIGTLMAPEARVAAVDGITYISALRSRIDKQQWLKNTKEN